MTLERLLRSQDRSDVGQQNVTGLAEARSLGRPNEKLDSEFPFEPGYLDRDRDPRHAQAVGSRLDRSVANDCVEAFQLL